MLVRLAQFLKLNSVEMLLILVREADSKSLFTRVTIFLSLLILGVRV